MIHKWMRKSSTKPFTQIYFKNHPSIIRVFYTSAKVVSVNLREIWAKKRNGAVSESVASLGRMKQLHLTHQLFYDPHMTHRTSKVTICTVCRIVHTSGSKDQWHVYFAGAQYLLPLMDHIHFAVVVFQLCCLTHILVLLSCMRCMGLQTGGIYKHTLSVVKHWLLLAVGPLVWQSTRAPAGLLRDVQMVSN